MGFCVGFFFFFLPFIHKNTNKTCRPLIKILTACNFTKRKLIKYRLIEDCFNIYEVNNSMDKTFHLINEM